MAMTREEKSAYAKGYSAGSKSAWPAHRPPLPPDPLIRQCLEAMRALRDAADSASALFDEDDEYAKRFDPGIQAVDDALIALTMWLRQRDAPPLA